MASRGRSARNKGLTFERWVAEQLRPLFPGVRRQLEFQIQDAKGVDLQGCHPYKIQCKKLAKYVSINTIKEIQCCPEFGDVPILITAGDNEEAMAVLPFAQLVRLLKKVHKTVDYWPV